MRRKSQGRPAESGKLRTLPTPGQNCRSASFCLAPLLVAATPKPQRPWPQRTSNAAPKATRGRTTHVSQYNGESKGSASGATSCSQECGGPWTAALVLPSALALAVQATVLHDPGHGVAGPSDGNLEQRVQGLASPPCREAPAPLCATRTDRPREERCASLLDRAGRSALDPGYLDEANDRLCSPGEEREGGANASRATSTASRVSSSLSGHRWL